ncbi:DUF4397 domain-containing protein [Blastococcus sp. URHD0036]|uniref:DUF4397 domain-containing protein n=1 Tax=Blastococcus sp. URHD0036 TaxID=1380356 RepID=UPI0009DDCA2B|nr:DUF4397 domain-containing protein [Blastococcus sp. URHD0036]
MRITRAVVVALLAALCTALPLTTAQAADTGLLRLAHLSPDTPEVDVYVDSVSSPGAGQTFPGVGYGTVSDYQQVPPGTYAVSMRQAGADPGSPPVLSTTVEVDAGQARTVAGVGPFASLGLEVLEDDLTPPPPGTARVRVVAAAASAEQLGVTLADGTSVAGDLAFADTSDYVEVPAGASTLQVTPAGGQPVSLPVDVAGGSVYSVLVLDSPDGGLTVRPTLDAAGTEAVPAGGVEAGAGGAAATSPWPLIGTGLLVALAVVTGLLALAGRTGRRVPAGRHSTGS